MIWNKNRPAFPAIIMRLLSDSAVLIGDLSAPNMLTPRCPLAPTQRHFEGHPRDTRMEDGWHSLTLTDVALQEHCNSSNNSELRPCDDDG